MKKLLVLMIASLMLLTACAPGSVTPDVTEAPTEAATEVPEETEAPVVTAPYTDARAKYTYIYENERDRKWEEDIVCFANLYLDPYRGHPLLSDRVTDTLTFNDLVLRYSTSSLENYFDPELKDRFMAKVNETILSIPESSDEEICFALKEAVALLGDVHSMVSIPNGERFPLEVFCMTDGETEEAVIASAPASDEDVIGCIMTAVNGVPVKEITERMRPMIPCENEAGYFAMACLYIDACPFLRYAQVMGPENTAVFTFKDPEGNELTREFTARDQETLWNDSVDFEPETEREDDPVFIMYSGIENAWHTMLMDGEVLYFRINSCMVDDDFGDVVEAAFGEAAETGKLKKVIVDFRSNSGGYADLDGNFLPLANAMRDSGAELYVLIDSYSFSAAVSIPSMLRRRVEGVTLIGEAAGQPVRFFYGGMTAELPNSGVLCYCSKVFGDFWPEYSDDPLAPDVIVKQTYEDFLNGIDSVLHYVLFG